MRFASVATAMKNRAERSCPFVPRNSAYRFEARLRRIRCFTSAPAVGVRLSLEGVAIAAGVLALAFWCGFVTEIAWLVVPVAVCPPPARVNAKLMRWLADA